MKVLLCHNYYQQPGGEDESFAAEGQLLEWHGHQVVRYMVHNDAIHGMRRWEVIRRTFWNGATYRNMREVIRRERPTLLHATNIFPLISPAVYDAARAEGIPVVQSLRNYRLMCPRADFLRDGRVCEDCRGKPLAWPGILHKCYRRSRSATAVVAGMSAFHRLRGTWKRAVDVYFTPSDFSRQKFVQGGLPPEKIMVKPNFVDPDPGTGVGARGYAVFVGRLSAEKGLDVLLEAWEGLNGSVPLKIIGDGPLRDSVKRAAQFNPAIESMGRLPHDRVLDLMGDAACVVVPSVCYETFGRAIVEAFSRGTPVIASRLGAMAELIEEGSTGWLFEPGSARDLRARVTLLMNSPAELPSMRRAARNAYLAKFTAEANYHMLLDIYHRATEANVRGTYQVFQTPNYGRGEHQ